MAESSRHFPDAMRRLVGEVEPRIEGMHGYLFEAPNGSQAVFWECSSEASVPPHKHDYDEYCVVVEGECEEYLEGRAVMLRKGDELHIPAGTVHWATIKPPYRSVDFFAGPRFRRAR